MLLVESKFIDLYSYIHIICVCVCVLCVCILVTTILRTLYRFTLMRNTNFKMTSRNYEKLLSVVCVLYVCNPSEMSIT